MAPASLDERFQFYLDLNEDVRTLTGGPRDTLRRAFADLIHLLEDVGAPYALFGAFAVAVYTDERRTTRDIDVVTGKAWIGVIREQAHRYGFTEIAKPEDARIRNFVHQTGVHLDVLFDEHGFADLHSTQKVTFAGIGDIRVATAFDIAYAKLRTQRGDWPRDPSKRATDYGDLVALLRGRPAVARELLQKITPGQFQWQQNANIELREVLLKACREAGAEFPDVSFFGRLTRRRAWWFGFLLVLAVLLVLVGVALLATVIHRQ